MPKAGRLTQLKVKEEDSHLKTEQVEAGNARKHTAVFCPGSFPSIFKEMPENLTIKETRIHWHLSLLSWLTFADPTPL
jgi:hypothetical protein